jgi:transposase
VRRKRSSEDRDPDAGTVDNERFVYWVEHTLCPYLGNYYQGKARSILVMDNASTHMHAQIKALNEARGAIVMYQPPYSPDLNPIEFCFHQYKSHLARNHWQYGYDPYLAHYRALGSVNRANMINYYRKVGCIRNLPAEDDTERAAKRRRLFAFAGLTCLRTMQMIVD